MVLTVKYRNSNGELLAVRQGASNDMLRKPMLHSALHKDSDLRVGRVGQCPKEVAHMSTDEIRRTMRVLNESNGLVELEIAKGT